MLRDVERCWKILGDIAWYWEILGDIDRYWQITKKIHMKHEIKYFQNFVINLRLFTPVVRLAIFYIAYWVRFTCKSRQLWPVLLRGYPLIMLAWSLTFQTPAPTSSVNVNYVKQYPLIYIFLQSVKIEFACNGLNL